MITNNNSHNKYYYYYICTRHREPTASKNTAVASMLLSALIPFVIPSGVVLLRPF